MSVACVCGAPIKRVTLPPDIARASGRTGFWNHVGGDIYCYEGDCEAMAEPLDANRDVFDRDRRPPPLAAGQVWVWMQGAEPPRWEIRGTGALL